MVYNGNRILTVTWQLRWFTYLSLSSSGLLDETSRHWRADRVALEKAPHRVTETQCNQLLQPREDRRHICNRNANSVFKRPTRASFHLVTVHPVSMLQGKCFSQWNGYGISNNSQRKCITDDFSKKTDIWDAGRAKTEAEEEVKLHLVPNTLGIASYNALLLHEISVLKSKCIPTGNVSNNRDRVAAVQAGIGWYQSGHHDLSSHAQTVLRLQSQVAKH